MKFLFAFLSLLIVLEFVASAKSRPKKPKNEKSKETEKLSNAQIGPVVIITGANRGLGLAIVELLVKDPSVKVIFATCRLQSEHERLEKFTNEYNKNNKNKKYMEIVDMEMSEMKSMRKGLKIIRTRLGKLANNKIIKKPMINTLIHNAGMMDTAVGWKQADGQLGGGKPGVHVLGVDQGYETFIKHFIVNTAAPPFITSKLKDLLDQSDSLPRVIFISSTISVLENFLGTRHAQNVAYPMSKSALNSYMLYLSDSKTFKKQEKKTDKIRKLYVAYTNLKDFLNNDDESKCFPELKEWITFSLCPGWVETDMGNLALTEDATVKPTSAAISAARVLKVIRTKTEKDSGSFFSLATKSVEDEPNEWVWRKDLKGENGA